MGQSEATHLFGVSLSSVKRYLRKCRQGRSLSPGKILDKLLNIYELAQRLLEEDLKERSFGTLQEHCEYLRVVAGKPTQAAALRPPERPSIHPNRRTAGDTPSLVNSISCEAFFNTSQSSRKVGE